MSKSAKKKLIYQKELEDQEGISRRKSKFRLTLKQLYICKITVIVLILFFFFVYSPALIFLLTAYAGLFFLSVATEKSINKSYLKRNRLKIHKFDHAVALLVVIVAVVAGFSGATTQTKRGTFDALDESRIAEFMNKNDMEGAKEQSVRQETTQKIKDIFTLMTGERNAFGSSSATDMSNFGIGKLPEDFTPPEGFTKPDSDFFSGGDFKPDGDFDFGGEDMPTLPEDFDFGEFRRDSIGRKSFDMKLSDVPVYYLFSSMLSIVASVLVFLVPLLGVLQMIFTAFKKKKVDDQTFSAIMISLDFTLSEELLEKVLDYGEETVLATDYE